jgi:DNA-binding Xre family transcriptional regulator
MSAKGVIGMIVYKIDVIETLRESGYNSTRILRENLVSQSAMQKMRNGEIVGIKTLDQICALLDMQPGNIIKYVEDEK